MIQQTTIRLPVELYKRLKEGATKKGLTLNAYIIGILWESAAVAKVLD